MYCLQTIRSIVFIIGIFLLLLSVMMTIPMIINFNHKWENFSRGFSITLVFGIACILIGKFKQLQSISKVFITVGCVWVILALFAAIPFYLDNLSYTDALFEAISGLTTTGATIFNNVEKQSPGILLWRAILHSVGGIGILTTGTAIFPNLKIFKLSHLSYFIHSEDTTRTLPHIRSIILYTTLIYYGLILVCILFYYLAGMSLFDSICHGMSTVSTGGFSNYSDSIGHYNNPTLEVITIIFMILGSLPFLSYLKVIKRLNAFHLHSNVFHDEQVSFFIRVIIVSSLLTCFWSYRNIDLEISKLFRYSIFTIISLMTSTGHAIHNNIDWLFISVLTFFLTFIGGCSGSSSGGIKIFRIIILLKSIKKHCISLRNSNENYTITFNEKILEQEEINSVLIFFSIYVLTFATSSTIMAYLSNTDFLTSITSVSAMITNSGPGFTNLIGPSGNYSFFSNEVKLFLAFLMLVGRLEMLPIYFCLYNLVSISFNKKNN